MNGFDYFLLYAYNIPVKGRESSAIYNLREGHIMRINNRCFELLLALKQKSIQQVKTENTFGDPTAIDKCLQVMLDQNMGFLTETPQFFPSLDLEWVLPNSLHTAIVEHDFGQYHLYDQVLAPLDSLLCRHIEFRLYGTTPQRLLDLADYLADKTVRSVSFLLPYESFLTSRFLKNFYERCAKVDFMLIYDAPEDADVVPQKVYWRSHWLPGGSSKTPRYVVNLQYFTESQHHNPYYNRKVAISRNGQIKNCLQLAESHGQVTTDGLVNVVHRLSFQELWFSAPDCIKDIQDSPLRYGLFIPYPLTKTDQPGQYQIANA